MNNPSIGQRIRLKHAVERFDSFLAGAGLTGTVNEIDPQPQERKTCFFPTAKAGDIHRSHV
jgi:hypothetical protein